VDSEKGRNDVITDESAVMVNLEKSLEKYCSTLRPLAEAVAARLWKMVLALAPHIKSITPASSSLN